MSVKVASGPPQEQGRGEDPLLHYTRTFTKFLQLVFASFEKGSYKWLADQEVTDIVISDQNTVSNEVVEKKPAILLARGPVSFGNISLDQFHSEDMQAGRKTHTDLVSGVMTYNVLASEGLEAQRIAYICAMATRRLKKTLMRAGPLHRVGEEVQIGPESPPGSLVSGDPSEIIMVSVSIPFYYPDAWSIEPIDKVLLNDLKVALTSQTTTLNPVSINGRVLQVVTSTSISSVRVEANASTPRSRK